MPTAVVVAATSAGYPARTFSLFLDGLDVVKQPGGAGYGVPLESIEVVEAGPGATSSMRFVIDDPAGSIDPTALALGPPVLYVDQVNNLTLFRGVVDTASSRPDFGGQGRTIEVGCTGDDSWLDDRVVVPVTIGNGTPTWEAIAQVAHQAAPELYAPAGGGVSFPPASLTDGNADWPIGFLKSPTTANATVSGALAWDGGTLRAAIDAIVAQSIYIGSSGWERYEPAPAVSVTIDFDRRLRVWRDLPTAAPEDYSALVVTDTHAGARRAEGLSYELAPGDVIRSVFVQGASPTAYVWVNDGSGIVGRQARIADDALTTEDQATQAGQAYLATQAAKVRGSFDLVDFTPPAGVHAGSLLTLTDAAAAATGSYRIYTITKTFHASGRQTWGVAFGGNRPSAMALARRLTRDTI